MTTIGFAGTGVMGQPMAMKLAAANAAKLIVWNRTSERLEPIQARYREVVTGNLDQILRQGTERLLPIAGETVRLTKERMGVYTA